MDNSKSMLAHPLQDKPNNGRWEVEILDVLPAAIVVIDQDTRIKINPTNPYLDVMFLIIYHGTRSYWEHPTSRPFVVADGHYEIHAKGRKILTDGSRYSVINNCWYPNSDSESMHLASQAYQIMPSTRQIHDAIRSKAGSL